MKKALVGCALLLALAMNHASFAQITIPAGSYVINMGINTSTKPAGLRPYGMIHELVRHYNVPVLWVIRQGKTKDAVDYTIEGVAYKGGLFIIPGQYVTAAVSSAINGWTTGSPVSPNGYTRGMVSANAISGAYTFSGAKYDTIKAAPSWTLDAQSGSIAQGFIANAGIPSTAYNYLAPSQLSGCSDIFVMPHADPSWATHGNLVDWNLNYKGAIWLGCHAGSAMENMYNPDNTSEQANFLSNKTTTAGTGIILPVSNANSYAQNALMLWSNHSNATTPFATNTTIAAPQSGTAANADDWVSQFIGSSDAAHLNGSEQVYLPAKGQSWRSATKIVTYDPSHSDIPANSSGAAALLAYGYGYGDTARGLVMLSAGHSIDKGTAGDVAAQRAFFNWSYLATKRKAVVIGNIAGVPASGSITGSLSLSVAASSPVPLTGSLTYSWSATQLSTGAAIGSFSTNNGTTASTTYNPGTIASNTDIVISVKVTDPCGRTTTSSTQATLMPAPRAPIAANDAAQIMTGCYLAGISKTIAVLANDSDPDNNLNPASLLLVNPTNSAQTGSTYTVNGVGTWTKSGTNIIFTPAANFFGSASINYKVSDNTTPSPLSAMATVTVGIGTTDARGCFPGSVWDIATTLNASAQTNNSVFNPSFALGDADYDPLDSTTYAEIDASGDALILDFGSTISRTAYDSIAIFFATDNASSSITASFEGSTNGTTFTALGSLSTMLNSEPEIARFVVPSTGIRYVRIKRTVGTAHLLVDAAEAEKYDCISAMPNAADDDITVLEDVPAVIDVTSNDDNPGDYPLSLTVTSAPSHGSVSVNTDGTITYVNTTDYPGGTGDGSDQFTYQICNSQGLCNSGTVNITISNDGCSNGQHRPATGGSVVTKVFAAGYNNTYAASANSNATFNFTDALLDKHSPNTNKDNDSKIDVGRTQGKRGVYYFNTSEIPSNAVVQSAALSLFRESGDGLTQTVYIHALKKDFVESQVTWNKASTSVNWAKAGGDYAATALGSTVVGTKNKYYNFTVTSEVQNWVTDTTKNFGLLAKTDEVANKRHQFTTSEGGGNKRPRLTVTYAVPAPCSATPNRAPLANPDYITTTTGAPVTISPLSNDNDPDGNTKSLSSLSRTNPSLGSVVTSGATINYTPNGSAPTTRIDTLLYTVSDGTLTDSAYIFVTVNNATPSINRDNSSAGSGSSQTINLAANDSDADGDILSDASVTVQPRNGAYTLSGNSITYTPNPGFYGIDSLIYQRCEISANGCSNAALCDTAVVVFSVSNRPPTATTKYVTISQCLNVNFTLNGSTNDPEGEPLTVAILPYNTSKGTLVTNTDGSFTFSPAANFPANSGTDTARILYQLSDPGMLSSIDTIIITVGNPQVNSAPNAVDDPFNTTTGEGITMVNQDVTLEVLANDYDPDGNSVKVNINDASLRKPAHGSLQLLANGQIRYIPDFNFNGKDTFQYRLCDTFATPQTGCSSPASQCDLATATVRVDLITTSSIRISGTVWNDANGSAGNGFANIYNAGETGTNAGGGLFVYLINASGNIIEKASVSTSGNYTLSGAPASASNLKLVLTNVNASVGAAQPATILPAGWVASSPLIQSSIATSGVYLSSKDFGIEELPTAGSGTVTIQNLWGTTQINISPTAFNSTSASLDPAPGSIAGILITSMPTGISSININNTIYGTGFTAFPGSGVLVAANANGQPIQTISIDPAINGATSVDIPFLAVDNAGKSSLNTGHLIVTLTDPSISGNIYDDGVNNNSITGTLISSASTQPLYINLVNASGNVVGSVPVLNGAYTLNQPNGVLANASFNVVLSTVKGVAGTTTGATPSLPANWAFTAEGTAAGDANRDGLFALTTGTTNTIVNFGIDQIPVSNNATAAKQLNPGGAKQAPVPSVVFTGSDAEDGTYNSGLGGKTVTLYPGANGDLYYDGSKVTDAQTINSFSANKVTFDPKGPDSTGWVAITSTFAYSVTDNADYASTPDTITLPFDAALCINLRVYLEGALINNNNAVASDGRPLMRDGLRNSPFTGLNIIPPFDPYTTSTAYVNVTGKSKNLPPQTTYTQFQHVTDSTTVFSVTGQNAIVDWVYVELRNKANKTNIIGCRAGLIQRDGDIVDVDGISCLKFPDIPIDSYYVSIEHRTHLGTMTKYPQSPSALQTLVDFSVASTQLWDKGIVNGYNYTGLSQKANVNGTFRAMWQGDFNCDGKVKYDTPNDDLSTMPFEVRRHPNNTKQTTNNDFAYGYRQADYDMNGKVKFDNPNDDNAMLLFQVRRFPVNVNHTTNFDLFTAQLP
jgi:hypothetical protein